MSDLPVGSSEHWAIKPKGRRTGGFGPLPDCLRGRINSFHN